MDVPSTRARVRRSVFWAVAVCLLVVGLVGAAPGSADAAPATVNLTMACTTSVTAASATFSVTSSLVPDPPLAGMPVDLTIVPGTPTLAVPVGLNSVVITEPIPPQISPSSLTVSFVNGPTPANLTGSYVVSGSNVVLTFTGAAVSSDVAVLPKVIAHGIVSAGSAGQTFTLAAPTAMTANVVVGGLLTLDASCTRDPSSPTTLNSWPIVPVPSAPTFVSASPGNASAKVSWFAPAANGSPITGYVVTPYLGGVAQPARTFASTATTQVVGGLTNGTSYTFKIAATNANGTGPQSVATNAALVGAPSTPTAASAQPGVTSATVTWVASSANGSPITGYVITPYLGAVAQPARTFASTAASQVVTGLTTGASYSFKVAATNAVGSSPQSLATPVIKIGAPTAPPLVTVTAGNAQATLTWWPSTANQSPVTNYVITPYIGLTAQPARTFGPANTAVVTGLTNGTAYTFKIVAVSAYGTSPASNATTALKIGTPLAPTNVTATPGTKQATVTWTAGAANGTPAATGYVVTPFVNGFPLAPRTFLSTATSQVITGLTSGTAYTFKVAAINANGTGLVSRATTVITVL